MTDEIGKPEKVTQNRVIELFTGQLGYAWLGNWANRTSNSNVEEDLLQDY